ALLDLVSAGWMQRLAEQCAAAGAAVLFALTYDGRSDCDPRDPDDGLVLELFNAHQRRNDKGFGRAAGPDAADTMIACLTAAGYHVERAASDWRLGQDVQALQRGLIEGWAHAAREIAPEHAGPIARWLDRRLAAVAEGRSRITVGH